MSFFLCVNNSIWWLAYCIVSHNECHHSLIPAIYIGHGYSRVTGFAWVPKYGPGPIPVKTLPVYPPGTLYPPSNTIMDRILYRKQAYSVPLFYKLLSIRYGSRIKRMRALYTLNFRRTTHFPWLPWLLF